MNNDTTNWKAKFRAVLAEGAKATQMEAMLPKLTNQLTDDQYDEVIANKELIELFESESQEIPTDKIEFTTDLTNWSDEFQEKVFKAFSESL